MLMDESRPTSFFGGTRPVSFLQRTFRPGHNVAPSISSVAAGPGVAGQGAYKYQQNSAVPATPATGQYYDEDPSSQHLAQTQEAQRALQPRQQYTFGQMYDGGADEAAGVASHSHDDHTNGAYSSEPQAQDAYDSQAYGNYYAYSPEQVNYGSGAHPSGQNVASGSGRVHNDDAYGGM